MGRTEPRRGHRFRLLDKKVMQRWNITMRRRGNGAWLLFNDVDSWEIFYRCTLLDARAISRRIKNRIGVWRASAKSPLYQHSASLIILQLQYSHQLLTHLPPHLSSIKLATPLQMMFVEKSFALVYSGETRARIEFRRIQATRRFRRRFPTLFSQCIVRGHLPEVCIFVRKSPQNLKISLKIKIKLEIIISEN